LPNVNEISPLSAQFLDQDRPTQQRLLASLRSYWGPQLDPVIGQVRRLVELHDQLSLWLSQNQSLSRGRRYRRSLAQGELRVQALGRCTRRLKAALMTWALANLRAARTAADWEVSLDTLARGLKRRYLEVREAATRPEQSRPRAVVRGQTYSLARACGGQPRSTPEALRLLRMTPPLSIQKLKLRYRRRALRHHPDRGGDAACMAAINLAFDRLLSKLKGE
jgi:hypothetical protein